MLIQFPLPLLPPFLKIDLSDLAAFIGFIMFGGMAGIMIIVVKILLYGLLIASEPIGPIANLLAAMSLLIPMYLVYLNRPTKNGLIIGFVIGTLVLTMSMSLLNYFVLLPAYGMIVDLTDVISNTRAVIAAGIIPFNLIKGILVMILGLIIYEKFIPKLKSVLK